ncbi:MAG: DUF1566 domain-containing protein [Spirochaetia bacterium]|nr:DUF1566 domain-containing protein [Spirochaetia bacterium]
MTTRPTKKNLRTFIKGALVTIIMLTASFCSVSDAPRSGENDPQSDDYVAPMTDAEAVATDKAFLEITYIGDDTFSSVTGNITLATSGSSGTDISWQSDNLAVIANDGTVTRPSFTSGDTVVTLTATIVRNTAIETKEFTLTVIKLPESDDEAITADLANIAIIYEPGDSESNVTQNISLPTSGSSGTTISWASDNTSIINTDGTVTEPGGNVIVALTATVTKDPGTPQDRIFYLTAAGIPPYLVSSIPDNTETNVSPSTGTITVTFNEAMNTVVEPVFSASIFNGTSFVSVPTTGTTLNWTNNTTLVINVSWVYFPENSQIQYTLAAANLQDSLGNAISADVQRTFTTTTNAVQFPVFKTNLTACFYDTTSTWNDEGNIIEDTACAQTYTEASTTHPYGQDAHYQKGIAQNYTGPTLTYTDDYTTSDIETGLVWQTCLPGLSGADCATGSALTMDWYTAVNTCATLNTENSGAGYAGRTTWRLAMAKELDTLQDHGKLGPTINETFFPGTVVDYYWPSSATASNPSNAWFCDFTGNGIERVPKTSSGYARCVSTETVAPAVDFVDNGNGTISDNVNSLLWQKCSKGQDLETCLFSIDQNTWVSAISHCENLSLGSRTDWRLPSINELKNLLDLSKANSSINETYFPETAAANYWSSSSLAVNAPYTYTYPYAWRVNFNDGFFAHSERFNVAHVRCVADGL